MMQTVFHRSNYSSQDTTCAIDESPVDRHVVGPLLILTAESPDAKVTLLSIKFDSVGSIQDGTSLHIPRCTMSWNRALLVDVKTECPA